MKKVVPVFLFIVLYFFITLFMEFVALFLEFNDIVLLGLVNFVCIFAFSWCGKLFNMSFFNFKTVTFKNVLWSIVIFMGTNVTVNALSSLLPQEVFENQAGLEMAAKGVNPAILFFAIVFAAPIAEEMLFRGLIIQNVFKHHMWLGLIVSSMLFAFAHGGFTVTSFMTYGLMGAGLGLVYIKTKSLECAIFIHMLNNLIATLVMLGILTV